MQAQSEGQLVLFSPKSQFPSPQQPLELQSGSSLAVQPAMEQMPLHWLSQQKVPVDPQTQEPVQPHAEQLSTKLAVLLQYFGGLEVQVLIGVPSAQVEGEITILIGPGGLGS